MIAQRILGFTRAVGGPGAGQPEYFTLHIKDVKYECGHSTMHSAWQPTPEELALLNKGANVVLSIMGTLHPPVLLTVEPLHEADE